MTNKSLTLFLRKVEKTESCWLWRGTVSSNGYGVLKRDNKIIYVHRFSYAAYKGEIPKGYVIDHLCRNILCVNPAHLEAVTVAENVLRGQGAVYMKRGRVKCPNGHTYTKANTYMYNGHRHCRLCKAAAQKAFWERHKMAPYGEEHKPQKTHCKNGHRFDKVIHKKNGYTQQICLTCQRQRSKDFRRRVKTKA